MNLIIGEILFDELPQGKRPGGAPFNVAQHLSRMGLEAVLVSRVGTDESGDQLLSAVEAAGLSIQTVQRDPEHQTGRVIVTLSGNGIPSYDIVENVAYDHIDFQHEGLLNMQPSLIYFGSLIQRSESGRKRLHEYLAEQPLSTKRLYDMNLRPGCEIAEIIVPSLEQTDILKINDEELETTGQLLGSDLRGDALVDHLMYRFNIQTVALTKGAQGSALYINRECYEAPASDVSKEEIIDTVGAGDSFTSVLAWGLGQGLPPDEILRRAGLLAGRICTIGGAVPADDDFYVGVSKD